VPRNRRDVDRDLKVAELIEAAEVLFAAGGYVGTTMTSIAAKAGVAPNAVYWYFPSKDHLLVAVLDRKLEQAMADASSGLPEDLGETINVGLRRLGSYPDLGALVHQRAPHSAVVADFHNRLHQILRGFLIAAVEKQGRRGAEAELIADTIIAVLDSDPDHGGPRRKREELLEYLFTRLLGASPQARDRKRATG
jgi:AcrR family transcriptional regulator